MASLLFRIFRSVKRRAWNLHPRAFAWRRLQERHPQTPVIARLGPDLRVRIYPFDIIGKDIYVKGVFEKCESKFVRRFLKPGMVFFDVGANLGQYTLLAASLVGDHGQVHSFEPNSRMFGELQFNVELNNLSARCRLNRLALSDACGQGVLSKYEAGAEVYGSMGSHNRAGSAVIGHEDVTMATLDSYVEAQSVAHVDFIKMDIEGAELPALKGASALLSRQDAPAVLVELADVNTVGFGYKAIEAWNFLESFGYRLFFIDHHASALREAQRPPRSARLNVNVVALKEQNYGN